MKRVLVSAIAVLALAACSKQSDGAAKAPEATAAATPAAAGAPMKPPERKAGLWTQTISTGKMTQTTRICFSDEVNRKMTIWGQQGALDRCSQHTMSPTLGGWRFSSTCNLGAGGTIVSEGEAKGDFGSHYTVRVKSSTTGAASPQMNGPHEMTLEGTWQGPCPADFKPGDMEINGMKINMLAMGDPGAGMAGHRPSPAQIAAMRAQMKKQMAADEAAKN